MEVKYRYLSELDIDEPTRLKIQLLDEVVDLTNDLTSTLEMLDKVYIKILGNTNME